MDGAKARQGRRPMRQGEVERPSRDLLCIGQIMEPRFFGEGVCVQPIDQLFAPRRDNARLGIVHMGINKTCGDQRIAIIGHWHIGMGAAQVICFAHGSDCIAVDQHRSARRMMANFFPR